MSNRTLSIFSALLFISSLAIAQTDDDNTEPNYANELRAVRTTVPFLTIAPDSRAGAIGDAGAATAPDLISQNWNPAKYMFMKQASGFAASFTPWLKNLGVNDIYLAYLSGFYKFDEKQAFSAGLRYFSLGEIQLTDNNGDPINTTNPNEWAFDVAYSRLFSDYISGALAFRFIRSDIAGGTGYSNVDYNPGSSFAADIAMYYQRPVELDGKESEVAFGLNISNIGNKMSYSDSDEKEFIPTNLRLGGRFTMELDEYNKLSIVADISKLLVPTPPVDSNGVIIAGKDDNVGVIKGMVQSFGDAPGGFEEELHEYMYSLGAEYWYRDQFAIRGGYFNEHEYKGNRKYFTAGIGLKLNVFSIDFSYLIPAVGGRNSPLANTIRFTIGFTFE